MTTSTPRFSAYQIRLFVFLSVATFFEGYDFFALTQILPNLRADMGLGKAEAGTLIAFINLGPVLAYFLVRQADHLGRRRMLTYTIAGYTIFTFLTGFAPNAILFAGCQIAARTFLVAEWAISTVYAAEEFPAERRGMVIGVISACSSLGGIVCAGVVPLILHLPYGWRSVYFIGIVPLVLLAFARRSLAETRRFAEQPRSTTPRSFVHLWHTPYRRRMLHMALIWAATYMCSNVAVTFWKDFAINERQLSDGQVGTSVTIAALLSAPLILYAGVLIDRLGRKSSAVLIFSITSLGVFGAYTLHGQAALTVALTAAIFGAAAAMPVLNAFNTELFPTHLRGDAFAWSNNLLGRITYVLSPLAIGAIASDLGWGAAVRMTAVFPFLVVVLIYLLLPETGSKELEETAAL